MRGAPFHMKLLQMLCKKLAGALPGAFGAFGVVGLPGLVEESVASIVPVRFERHFALAQLGFQGFGCGRREDGIFLRKMKLQRFADGLYIAGLLGRKTVPR